MNDKQLRKLQDEFLGVLEESGFHKRNKDGMTVPLFDKDISPNVIQLQRGLWPAYATKMQEFVEERRAREETTVRVKPAYYRHITLDPSHQDRPGGDGLDAEVCDVSERDTSREGRSEVPAVPRKRLVKRQV